MTILYNSEVLLSSPQTGRIPDAVPSALPQGGVSSCEIKRVLKMSCWLRCLGKAVLAGLGGRVTVLIFLPPHPGCWRTESPPFSRAGAEAPTSRILVFGASAG
ncbi:hypothetical protein AV530_017548 [Patagioenas fasciata monilis]|uniref:Uncharacterized protein n=1 Tax=Patagioenas fasciata monilis TaxID=372326 RepID=A0A1V4JD05_PATFA|nr:hypothetical protein AV530_017548 [Patagioenas fasciata monilis]